MALYRIFKDLIIIGLTVIIIIIIAFIVIMCNFCSRSDHNKFMVI